MHSCDINIFIPLPSFMEKELKRFLFYADIRKIILGLIKSAKVY